MRIALLFLVCSACDGGYYPPDAPPKRDAPADAEVDAPGLDAFVPPCLTGGTYDADEAWPFTSGPYAITGTVTLPASVASGHAVQLDMVMVGGGNFVGSSFLNAAKTQVTYRASGLPNGTWRICMKVDVDGNQMYGDVGVDYVGCYDGTTTTPIKTSDVATDIVLGGACQPNRNFGVGLQ